MNTNTDITKTLVLVKLSFGTYAGTVSSDKLAKETAQAHDADEDSITTKIRALRPETIRRIRACRTRARDLWKMMTLPWEDDGKRACPAAKYRHLRDSLEAVRVEWQEEVQKMIDDYENIERDMRERLNGLADQVRFPSKQDLANRYRFQVSVSSLPRPSDVRLESVSQSEIDSIKAEMEQRQQATVEEAQRDVLRRVEEVLGYLVERLESGKKFKDSLTKNVAEIAQQVEDLNVIGSKALTDLAAKLRSEVAVEADTLRDDEKAQKKVKKTAEKIIGELADFQF